MLLRGRRSRNKVSVGEPAEGSFARIVPNNSIMIFASSATVTGDVEKLSSYTFSSYILQNFLRRSRYLLRSYSGECLGSSSDEERSELRYAI